MRPVENSLLLTLMTTLSMVRPWDLWMVTAHASLRGSWSREHSPPPEEDQQRQRGVMGMVPSGKVADHDSNGKVRWASSDGSIDEADINPEVAGEHHSG